MEKNFHIWASMPSFMATHIICILNVSTYSKNYIAGDIRGEEFSYLGFHAIIYGNTHNMHFKCEYLQ